MPVVSLVSPKGGVGKTTTALLIASTLHHRGQNVVLLDGDPNQPLTNWSAEGRNALPIIGGVRSETIVSVIDREAPRRDLVIVDTEGSAQRLTSRAIARSDLVVVPMGASTLDAAQAARAVSLIQQEEELLRRTIACRIVFTRTGKVQSKAERALTRELVRDGVATLATTVWQRAAYEAMFAERVPLRALDPGKVSNLEAAFANAEALVDEILGVLAGAEQGRAAA
jgi:chromosome partitioning protein